MESGSVLSILGRNGTGKTTFLKCLLGLLKWRSGETLIDGEIFKGLEKSSCIAYVPQVRPQLNAFSVAEMVSLGLLREVPTFGQPSKHHLERIDHVLEMVGIQDLKNKLCNQLSGGQLQMVNIARALVSNPTILVMDEPEAHLDYCNQAKVLKLIEILKSENGISTIFNTHSPTNAARVSNQTLFMSPFGHLFGDSQSVICKENLDQYLNINSEIMSVSKCEKTKAFAVIF